MILGWKDKHGYFWSALYAWFCLTCAWSARARLISLVYKYSRARYGMLNAKSIRSFVSRYTVHVDLYILFQFNAVSFARFCFSPPPSPFSWSLFRVRSTIDREFRSIYVESRQYRNDDSYLQWFLNWKCSLSMNFWKTNERIKMEQKWIHLTNRGSTRKHEVPRYREIFSTLASIQASSKSNSSSLLNSSSMLLYYSFSPSSSSSSSNPFALPFTSFQDWRISNGRTMPSGGGGKQSSSRPTFVLDREILVSGFCLNREGMEKCDFSKRLACVRGKVVATRWDRHHFPGGNWFYCVSDDGQPRVDLSYEGCRYGITLGRKTGSVALFGRMRGHPLQETWIEAVLETPSLSRTRWIIKENGLEDCRTGYFVFFHFFFFYDGFWRMIGELYLILEKTILKSSVAF